VLCLRALGWVGRARGSHCHERGSKSVMSEEGVVSTITKVTVWMITLSVCLTIHNCIFPA